MKESLRQKIEAVLKQMQSRVAMLEIHIEEYVKEGRLQQAVNNQIKRDQMVFLVEELKEALNN